jgi:hypothetical protein
MKKIKSILVILFFLALPFLSFSQPDPRYNGNGSSVGNTPVGGPTGSPIDGGLSVFLALGLSYGVRKIYLLKKKRI